MAVGEWDHRELCPDGGCVGVIGPDGTCKVCGRAAPNWGDERQRGLVPAAADDDEHEPERADDAGEHDHAPSDGLDPIAPGAPAALGTAPEWQARQLCPDGACIGVIGEDGRCRVCGTTASPRRPAASSSDDAALAAAAAELAAVLPAEDIEAIAPAPEPASPEPAPDGDLEPARRLCPDGACVGVLGADGKCKLCGKQAA